MQGHHDTLTGSPPGRTSGPGNHLVTIKHLSDYKCVGINSVNVNFMATVHVIDDLSNLCE